MEDWDGGRKEWIRRKRIQVRVGIWDVRIKLDMLKKILSTWEPK